MKQIKISEEVKGVLDVLKHKGQTYDGVIWEILQEWKKLKEREKEDALQ